jgi:5-methylcytosine-specific restriction endonuclease McrA
MNNKNVCKEVYLDGSEFIKANTEEVEKLIKLWNDQPNFKKCRATVKTKIDIAKAFKRSNFKDLKTAIENYSKVYNDNEYFFDYKWDILRFLNRTKYIKFFNDGELWVAYKDNNKNDCKQPIKIETYSNVNGYDETLKHLKEMKYNEYLLTAHWKHFIKEAVKWSMNRCQLCNESNVMLHVHHKTYINRGRETFNDIIVLCKDCHKLVHTKPLKDDTKKV